MYKVEHDFVSEQEAIEGMAFAAKIYKDDDLDLFLAETGWEDWMINICYNTEEGDGEIDPDDSERIDSVLRKAFNRSRLPMVKLLRDRAFLTQQQLADMTGLPQQSISRLEAGERTAAKLELRTAAKLAKALGCHAEDLID